MYGGRDNTTTSELAENIKKGKDKIIQVYEMLPTYCQQEDVPGLLEELKETMKNYVELEYKCADLKSEKQKVAQDIIKKVSEGDEENMNMDDISRILKTSMSKAFEKHPEGFWERDRLYSSMKDFNAEGQHQEEEEPADGEELAVTGVQIQTIDPYTKLEFVDPVKNRRCNHSYERETILELIGRSNKTTVRCYHMGCNNRVPIQASDLIPDEDLKRHMARLKARPF